MEQIEQITLVSCWARRWRSCLLRGERGAKRRKMLPQLRPMGISFVKLGSSYWKFRTIVPKEKRKYVTPYILDSVCMPGFRTGQCHLGARSSAAACHLGRSRHHRGASRKCWKAGPYQPCNSCPAKFHGHFTDR